jgi:hypothetical protein
VTATIDKFFKEQGLRPMGTLAHVGIKGMKWGIRRSDTQLAKASSHPGTSDDAAKAKATLSAIKKGGTSAVSDADLNHLVNRINLEKRYSEIKSSTSLSKKTHTKMRSLLSVGDTINTAVKFAGSPAGRILASKLGLKNVTDVASKAIKDSKIATNPPTPPKEPKD